MICMAMYRISSRENNEHCNVVILGINHRADRNDSKSDEMLSGFSSGCTF